MSIPRAKIKTEASVVSAFSAAILGLGDKPRQMSSWYYRCTECGGRGDSWIHWENAADEATEHLREAHGVRTVGSLTAKDIGSWIEVEGDELDLDILGKIVSIEHMSGDHSAMTLMEDLLGDIYDVEFPSSTPCRVPEERP